MATHYPPSVRTIHIVEPQASEVPREAHEFLVARGWGMEQTSDVAGLHSWYTRNDGLKYPWYEAVAMEYIQLANLGFR